MEPTLVTKLLRAAWAAMPLALVVMGLLIALVPIDGLPGRSLTPSITLMVVYSWTIYQPDQLPPAAIFTAGIFEDLLLGGPVGVTALVLLFVYAVADSQRTNIEGRNHMTGWVGFGLIAVAAGILSWLLGSFYYSIFLNLGSFVIQTIMSIALYPLFAALFALLQNQASRFVNSGG